MKVLVVEKGLAKVHLGNMVMKWKLLEVQNDIFYTECKFCKKVVTCGVKRLKDHITCTRKNVVQCPKFSEKVKQEIIAYLKKVEVAKHVAQQNFDKMVNTRAYFRHRVSLEDVSSYHGPLDGLSDGTIGIR